MSATRRETDSFGAIDVPAAAYWGAQTQRSLENFAFGERERMPAALIHALAIVKQAAARVNRRHGLDRVIADAIEAAATAIASGAHDDQFPLTIWQTGSGTQTNMNVNEVIAGLANAAKIAKHAHANGLTLRAAARALGLVDQATFDRLVRPEDMVGGGG